MDSLTTTTRVEPSRSAAVKTLPARRGIRMTRKIVVADQLPEQVDGATEVAAPVPFDKLAETLLKHVDGLANYCEAKIRFGVVEAVNGNIRMLINRGRGYQNLRYMLLKAKRPAVTNVKFIALHTAKKAA